MTFYDSGGAEYARQSLEGFIARAEYFLADGRNISL
jgi:hypothetical protein